MNQSLIITVIGPDRPGFVGSLSKIIAEHNGNWTSSRMAHLAGQFAGMLHVIIPEDKSDALRDALKKSGGQGFSVSIVTDSELEEVSGERYVLDVVGQDRQGIVRQISTLLGEKGVNVEELSTSVESAPWSGDLLFKATALLRLPETQDADELKTELEELAGDLMVELKLSE